LGGVVGRGDNGVVSIGRQGGGAVEAGVCGSVDGIAIYCVSVGVLSCAKKRQLVLVFSFFVFRFSFFVFRFSFFIFRFPFSVFRFSFFVSILSWTQSRECAS
jgi:hypothetical protein